MKEATTAEFFSNSATDASTLQVMFNNKAYTWEQFIKLAKIDSSAKEVLALMERERQQDNFEGDLAMYLVKKYRHYSAPHDLMIKTRTDGSKSIDVDRDEMERVRKNPPQPKPRLDFS